MWVKFSRYIVYVHARMHAHTHARMHERHNLTFLNLRMDSDKCHTFDIVLVPYWNTSSQRLKPVYVDNIGPTDWVNIMMTPKQE